MFFKEVDMNSRKEMVDFLINHFRYDTMNSWNCSSSYAQNIKIHRLGLPNEITNALYELLNVEESYDNINDLIAEFGVEFDYRYQAGFNGRSGGYLVLYEGRLEPTDHKSFCTACGQKNFKTVEETGHNKCGRCGQPKRRNYEKPPQRVVAYPGRSIDQYEDFEDWDIASLRERVDLVQRFDKLCDDIVAEAIYLAENFKVEEIEVMVPCKVKVLQEA